MFADSIENDEILKLPRITFSGNILVIKNIEQLKSYLPLIQKCSILGFDTETKPNFRKGSNNGVALLQLSSDEITLVCRMKKLGIPYQLKKILEDERIMKVGVAIRDDIKALQRIKPFSPKGFVDLQKISIEKGIESQSVRKLAAIVLGVRISKSQQLSNWEAENLTESQLQYAATDSWICREIYLKLTNS